MIQSRKSLITRWKYFKKRFPTLIGTSTGKQKKAHSTSQAQFRSGNTFATIEANQILIALQHMATNSNSANFNNDINRILKLPKSLTKKRPFLTVNQSNSNCLKICSKQVQKSSINSRKKTNLTTSIFSCVVMRCKHSKTSSASTEKNWDNGKNVKPQILITAKH